MTGFGHLIGTGAVTVGLGAAAGLMGSADGWPGLSGARLAVVAAVLTLGVLPRLCVTCGGVATADFLVRSSGVLTELALTNRLRSAGMGVAGAALGVAVVAAGAGVRLAGGGDAADKIVVALAGLCLLVRSRLFGGTWSGFSLVLAGIALLAYGGYSLLEQTPAPGVWVAPVASAALAGLLMAAVQTRRQESGARSRRVLYWVEATGVTALVCAGAVAAGLVDTVHTVVG